MRLKPENGQRWMQWVWWWCYTSRSVRWRWWIIWRWWTEWTIGRRWTWSPPVMSTPACGAWVNLVSTCPPPQLSTPTPSVGKSKVKDRGGGGGAHTSGGVTPQILLDQLCYQYSLSWYTIYRTLFCVLVSNYGSFKILMCIFNKLSAKKNASHVNNGNDTFYSLWY